MQKLEQDFINIHGTLAYFTESPVQAAVLYELILLELHANRYNEEQELPVKISTENLAKRLHLPEREIQKVLHQLEDQNWITAYTKVRPAAYLVNIDRLVKSVATYERLTD